MLTITTQACERVYRSSGGHAGVATRLTVGEGATCAFVPQETILFDGGAIERTLHVDAAADATVLVCESVILGRKAMGETVTSGLFRDRWRVRIGGRLVFADDLRLRGAIAEDTRQSASLAGHGAFASILYAGADAEALRLAVRALVGDGGRRQPRWRRSDRANAGTVGNASEKTADSRPRRAGETAAAACMVAVRIVL